jgi:hypothetical protein
LSLLVGVNSGLDVDGASYRPEQFLLCRSVKNPARNSALLIISNLNWDIKDCHANWKALLWFFTAHVVIGTEPIGRQLREVTCWRVS